MTSLGFPKRWNFLKLVSRVLAFVYAKNRFPQSKNENSKTFLIMMRWWRHEPIMTLTLGRWSIVRALMLVRPVVSEEFETTGRTSIKPRGNSLKETLCEVGLYSPSFWSPWQRPICPVSSTGVLRNWTCSQLKRFLNVFFVLFFYCHIYSPFTRKRIVSLYFRQNVRTRLGVAICDMSWPPVFHIKAEASRLVPCPRT